MSTVTPPPVSEEEREHRTRWWKEALIMGIFYALYTATRNQFGSQIGNEVSMTERAFDNAMSMIRLERAMGLFHEETIQDWFMSHEGFIQFLNTYYGTAHFGVTIGVFIVLYRRRKDVFPLFRNALAAMTGLAIIGFALFPLMPPRLLDAPCPIDGGHGGVCIAHETRNYNGATSFGFSDTLKEFGGPWNFDSDGIASVSNQYAAMPSLHIGWASWCAFGMWPLARKRWVRAAVLLYPLTTLFCIVVTGNHYWIDGVGGLVALGAGFVLGGYMHRWNQDRLNAKFDKLRSGHPSSGSIS
jgi:membrane-associated phospholipid phosphatase